MISQPRHRRPAIEILGPWLMNKGDELMLRAVVERLGQRYELAASQDLKMQGQRDLPELPRVVWQPTVVQMRTALKQRLWRRILSMAKKRVTLPLLSRSQLRSRSQLNGRDLVALLDCSGFAYGDQWPPRRLVDRTRYYETLRRRDIKLIMLPQALGPFDDAAIRPHARQLLEQFDLIFPREAVSEQHVLNLGIEPAKVSVCPDLSHLLAGRRPSQPEQWTRRVAIVPNARMLDKTEASVAERYLNYLVICIERVRARNLEPCIFLHETNDDSLLEKLLGRIMVRPQVFDEDGVTSKGFFGACYANLGSRYHSLVSSLSQATPSIGTSWAHKYEELFAEYGCEDCLISPALEDDAIARQIDQFLEPERNEQLRKLLARRAAQQREKVDAMWQRVESMIPESP